MKLMQPIKIKKNNKKMSFLERWTNNVNKTTMEVQGIAVKHQMAQQDIITTPKPKWQSWLKLGTTYGGAILIGVAWGFFYGLISLVLISFIYGIIEGKFFNF